MHTTISQMLYPDRQAFFEKLALSLPPQPAIKIGPAPMPSAEHKTRIAGYAKGGAKPGTSNSHAIQRKCG
jgi:hypothetical protein